MSFSWLPLDVQTAIIAVQYVYQILQSWWNLWGYPWTTWTRSEYGRVTKNGVHRVIPRNTLNLREEDTNIIDLSTVPYSAQRTANSRAFSDCSGVRVSAPSADVKRLNGEVVSCDVLCPGVVSVSLPVSPVGLWVLLLTKNSGSDWPRAEADLGCISITFLSNFLDPHWNNDKNDDGY